MARGFRHRCRQLGQLADLFDVAEEALITFPELDHYADVPNHVAEAIIAKNAK